VPEFFITQITPEPAALGVFTYGHVKKNHSPLSVPRSRPALLGIAPTQHMQAPLFRQAVYSVLRRAFLFLNPTSPLQAMQLTEQTFTISSAFIGVRQIAECWPHQLVRRPEK